MQPTEYQHTEHELTEAFRQASIAEMRQQTKLLTSIRSMLTFFTVLAVIGLVFGLIAFIVSVNSSY